MTKLVQAFSWDYTEKKRRVLQIEGTMLLRGIEDTADRRKGAAEGRKMRQTKGWIVLRGLKRCSISAATPKDIAEGMRR